MKRLVSALCCSVIMGSTAIAQDTELMKVSNLKLVDQEILPNYQHLNVAATHIHQSVLDFCFAEGKAIEFGSIVVHFHKLMDAWQRVQWLRRGPATNSLLHSRFQYWPDKHGTGSRQFRTVLNKQDPEILERSRFIAGSVALQGIPALERIIFSEGAAESLLLDAEGPSFKCRYLAAIVDNLESMSAQLLNLWSGYYRDSIADPGSGDDFFHKPTDPTAVFFSQIIFELEFILFNKIRSPMGLDGKGMSQRIKKAESWRSGRSIKNIKQNLSALKTGYEIALDPLISSTNLSNALSEQWDSVVATFDKLSDSYEDALADQNEKLLVGAERISKLHWLIFQQLSVELDMPIGFNNLDGD